MNYSFLARTAIAAAAMTTLAGCGSLKSALGLERHVPDETQVVSRPALALPPDYDLRPPGTASSVSGEHEAGRLAGTPGEQSLEQSASAGAAGAPPREEKGFFGRLFSGDLFGGSEPEDPNQIWRPGQKAAAPADATASAAPAPAAAGIQAPPDAQATPAPAAPAEKPSEKSAEKPADDSEKPGFFGRIFGSIF